MSSRLASLSGSTPFKKPGPSAEFERFKRGCYLKKTLILNSFSFKDKDPRFTRLKPDLALRLLSKRLFYIRAMTARISNIYDRYPNLHFFFQVS